MRHHNSRFALCRANFYSPSHCRLPAQPQPGEVGERERNAAQQPLQLALLLLAAEDKQVPVVTSAEEQRIGPAEPFSHHRHVPAAQQHAHSGGRRRSGDVRWSIIFWNWKRKNVLKFQLLSCWGGFSSNREVTSQYEVILSDVLHFK